MLLAVDIGNSNIVLGGFESDQLKSCLRLKTDLARSADEYAALLLALFDRHFGSDFSFERAIISSVVPPLTPIWRDLLSTHLELEALVVGPGVKTGVAIQIEDPRTAGSDRIVNSLALKELYGCPGVVVDFGTATTLDVVGSDGSYQGGAIAPGVGIATDALVSGTAQLPKIELVWPKSVVGKNTVSCMQSGSVVGYVCMVDGLIRKMREEVGPLPHIVATGGFGKLMVEHSSEVQTFDPDLTLHGLRLIDELNQRGSA